MKKLIALGVSIVILITAFVLLPNQKSEDVIVGPGSKKDVKIENLKELEEMFDSSDIESGTFNLSYAQTGRTSETDNETYESISINVTRHFVDGVEYYQLKGSSIYRNEDEDDKKVLTYVYDIELYAEEDEMAIRFNFFDGYSNDSKVDPAIPVDQLGVWYDVGEDNYNDILERFGGLCLEEIIGYITSQDFDSLEKISKNVYGIDGSDHNGNLSYNNSFSVDLSDSVKPVFEVYYNEDYYGETSDMSHYITIDSTLTMSNLNNTEIEFDLDDVDLKKEKAFDWDFFEELFENLY